MKTNLRRTVVALTAACGLVLVMAAPASATTHAATVTAGTITLTKTGLDPRVIDMAPGEGSGCATGGMTVTSSNASPTGTVNATISSTSKFFFGGTTAADHFIAVITGGTTVTGGSAGTYNTTTTSATIASLTLRLTINIYSGGSTSCTPVTTNRVCTWVVTIHLAGTFTGDASAPVSSNSAALTGSSTGVITLGGTCAAPFTTYTSSSVSVTGLGVHIT